jgi:septal ring factor EnvC (AmiA/AmiB activator)
MVERKLRLKSSRLRKAHEDIAAFVNQNALNTLRESCAQAFSSSKQLTSSQETKVTKRKLKQLERKLERSQKRREAVTVRLEALEEERAQVLQKLEEQKKMLEQSVHDFLGSSISLKL